MTDDEHKKFTAHMKACIKGEAFFEAVVADYCLPHHIVAPKDLGIDYICEWVYGNRPTGILFAVQVKAFSAERRLTRKHLGVSELNRLKIYEISHSLLEINDQTRLYWRGLGIPVYLFVVVYPTYGSQSNSFECYYRRFTAELTVPNIPAEEIEAQSVYQEVYAEGSFLAFADQNHKQGGFARDLFVDTMRCSYSKGSIAWLNPRTMGLGEFPEEPAVFGKLFDQYRENLLVTYHKTKSFVEGLEVSLPSAPPFPEHWNDP